MAANSSRLKGLSDKSADDAAVDCLLFLLLIRLGSSSSILSNAIRTGKLLISAITKQKPLVD